MVGGLLDLASGILCGYVVYGARARVCVCV